MKTKKGSGTRPTQVLGHGVGLESKRVELVGVDGEFFLDAGQGIEIDEE